MDLLNKRVKNMLEYFFIFIIFFIGIRKGGYYKEDSLVGVYLIFLLFIIYFVLNYRKIKINGIVGTFFLLFSCIYFIPIILNNAATMSGAINIATRVYSMYLIYIIVFNSQNREKYIKAIVVFTIICGLFALDEISYRVFEKPLNLIGGGYVEKNNGRVASILQYSNLLGILSLISIVYLKNIDKKEERILPKMFINISISFLTIALLLTQSKMVLMLYMLTMLIQYVLSNEKDRIFDIIIEITFSIIAVSLIEKVSVWTIIPSLLVFTIYYYITLIKEKNVKYRIIFNIIILIVLSILFIFLYKYVVNCGILTSIKDYFSNLNSTKLRITYYVDAFKLIISSPLNFIFGIGGNAFRTMYETVQNIEYISLETHSMIIQIFLEAGVIGVITLSIILFYLLSKSKKNIYNLILIAIIIFSAFDVFFTYTFMLYILAIVMGNIDIKQRSLKKGDSIVNLIVFILIFNLMTFQVIAFFNEPLILNDINSSLEEQEKIIKKCEISLKFDPFDMDYRRNYTLACTTYLDILDIKEELYGKYDIEKKNEIINKIYKNVIKECLYEKNNKYAIEDSVYYVYKYLDELVISNYNNDKKTGYEYYLFQMLDNTQKLRDNHSKNNYAMEVYKKFISEIYIKYSYVNSIINSNLIEKELNTLKENEYISL